MRVPGVLLQAALLAGCGSRAASQADAGDTAGDDGGASVLQFHRHINRDGFYVDPAITEATAATMHRDATFDGTISGNVYAQPLYVEAGPGGKGVFYVVTEDDKVFALDETTGLPVWQRSVGTPAKQTGSGCGDIWPIGITGTPAIDLATRLLVLSAVTADGAGNVATHVIHALSIDDGSERWSLDVSTLTDQLGRPFSPQAQNQRSAVLIAGDVAYVAYGGNAYDCGAYHGWLVGVPLAGPGGAQHYTTRIQGAGMWAPGGPASDGLSIFAVTGNGTESVSTWEGSEGVYRFTPGPAFTGDTRDVFSPADWSQTLDAHDWDLGGSGPLVIDAPAMAPSTMVVAQGKDGRVYLLDRGNLGGVGATPLATERVINGAFIGAGAFATLGRVTYIALKGFRGSTGLACPNGTSGDLVVLRLDPGAPNRMTTVWCSDNQGQGAPIITSSDGQADALVWTAGTEDSGRLHAWDLATGRLAFAGGAADDAIVNSRRYTTVVDVKGRLIVAADGKVYAFKP
jgi:outer membrane protein assembly factor BamB